LTMLTSQEEQFLQSWEKERGKKRSVFNYTFGLRVGVFIIVLVVISILTGWHKRAAMVLRSNSSFILVIVIALISIVAFMSLFSSRYQWEKKEQQYKELLAKKAAAKQADVIN
jgi:hypothetical protein